MGKRHIPEYLSRKAKKKSVGTAALAVFLVLLAALICAVIGRYQRQFRSDGAIRAKEFYFTSNLLDGKTHTLSPGSTEIAFTLGNYADELRYSEVDITYEVTVTHPDGVAAPIVEYSDKSKTFAEGGKLDATVTIKGLNPGTYTIMATGQGGYVKTLTATIEVLSNEAQLYQHQEKTPEYTLLTVWNEGNEEGEVTIEYSGIPDNTNPNMTDWITGTEIAPAKKEPISILPHTSMAFRFFNSGTITVTKVDGTQVASKVPD